jgi:hypothetical protein
MCFAVVLWLGGMQAAGTNQQRETQNINSDLSQLTTCLHNLWRCQHEGASFVPSRQSPLTRILGKMLNGHGRLAVTLHISTADEDAELTRRTLEFGTRLLDIRTAPRRNDFRPVARLTTDARMLNQGNPSVDESAALCIQIGRLQADLQMQQEALSRSEAAAKSAQKQLEEEVAARLRMEGLCRQAASEAWRFASALKQAKKEAKTEQVRSKAIATQAATMHQLAMAGMRERLEAAQSEVAALRQTLQTYCRGDASPTNSFSGNACACGTAERHQGSVSIPQAGAAAAEPEYLAEISRDQLLGHSPGALLFEERHAPMVSREICLSRTIDAGHKPGRPSKELVCKAHSAASGACLQGLAAADSDGSPDGSSDDIPSCRPTSSGDLSSVGLGCADENALASYQQLVTGPVSMDVAWKRNRLRTKRTVARTASVVRTYVEQLRFCEHFVVSYQYTVMVIVNLHGFALHWRLLMHRKQ